MQVLDYQSNGAHRLLGEVESSALKLQQLAGGGTTEALAARGRLGWRGRWIGEQRFQLPGGGCVWRGVGASIYP